MAITSGNSRQVVSPAQRLICPLAGTLATPPEHPYKEAIRVRRSVSPARLSTPRTTAPLLLIFYWPNRNQSPMLRTQPHGPDSECPGHSPNSGTGAHVPDRLRTGGSKLITRWSFDYPHASKPRWRRHQDERINPTQPSNPQVKIGRCRSRATSNSHRVQAVRR
jgi:hypothetical protein